MNCFKLWYQGFSREAVSILEEYNSEYSYFDILQNEEVNKAYLLLQLTL